VFVICAQSANLRGGKEQTTTTKPNAAGDVLVVLLTMLTRVILRSMGRAWSGDTHTGIWLGSVKERAYWEDLGVDASTV
jgi:hypothetical protein